MPEHGQPVIGNDSERSGVLARQLLWLLETPGIGPGRVARLLARLEQGELPSAALADPAFLAENLHSDLVSAFRRRADEVNRMWDTLMEKGVRAISIRDPEYPLSLRGLLGRKAPPLLFALGNTDLLRQASVSFCGSRKASEKGMQVAAACAADLARAGVDVVSGYASGVDLHAHWAALEAGGTTTLVLAEGIQHFRVKRDIKGVWDESRTLVVSEFLPGLPWSVRNAMQRNRTIIGLSRAMVLIEARASGGSMQAGRECLRLRLPLFAAVYRGMPAEAEGNRELLQQGARPVLKSRRTGKPKIGPILAAIRNAGARPDPSPSNAAQPSLPLGT